MINVNDIIKLSDYKDIYLKEKDYFIYKNQFKSYSIKGDKVEKYILVLVEEDINEAIKIAIGDKIVEDYIEESKR